MSRWPVSSVGAVAVTFDGPHATPKTVDRGPIFLGIDALDNGRIRIDSTRHVTENDFKKWTKRVKPQEGDIVFSYETRLGQAAIIPKGLICCLGRRMALVRPNESLLDNKFFLYYFMAPKFQEQIRKNTINGATVDRIPLKSFPSFEIELPGLGEQKSIASILGALDDKIDLNRRTNETLEAMARALFRDWFVDFGPTRAKMAGQAPYLAPELWELFPDRLDDEGKPEGWLNGTLDNVTNLQNGYAFKSSDWLSEGIPVVKIGAVKPSVVDLNNLSFVSSRFLAEKPNFILNSGDILIGLTGYVGEVGRLPPYTPSPLLNQRVARFLPNTSFYAYVFCVGRQKAFKEFVENKAHGSAQANVSTKDILTYPITIPTMNISKIFEIHVRRFLQKTDNNLSEIGTLTQLRDLLLPKLMSGEIRIRDAEQMVANAL